MSALDRLAVGIATVGGAGGLPGAPGTFGALVAIPPVWLLSESPLALAAGALVLAVVGTWATARAEAQWGTHDDGRVVVDELFGAWLAMAPAAGGLGWMALGFALFRWLDIAKPGPIRAVEERVPGALGVMADDVVAGVLAGAAVGLGRMVASGAAVAVAAGCQRSVVSVQQLQAWFC